VAGLQEEALETTNTLFAGPLALNWTLSCEAKSIWDTHFLTGPSLASGQHYILTRPWANRGITSFLCSNLIWSKPSQCNLFCWSRINQNSSENFGQTWSEERENVQLCSAAKHVVNNSQIPQNASVLVPKNAA